MFNSYVSLPEGTCKYNICLDENPCKTSYVGFTSSPGHWRLDPFFSMWLWLLQWLQYGKIKKKHGNSWKIMENHPRLKTYFPVFADEDKLFRYVQNQPIPEIKTQTPILETLVVCNLICIGSEVWDVYWYGSNFPQVCS